MRSSISAQSAASTPPASARMVMRASRESYSPDRSVRTSSSPTVVVSEASSTSTSASVSTSSSASASSSITARSSRRTRSVRARASSLCRNDSLLVTTWAWAWSSQRLGTEACASRSAISSTSLGRSITCSMLAIVASRAASDSEISGAAMLGKPRRTGSA
ncbi:unannotated protein [freshwater metagenome]|uniref:Unannotated protein n=1 Tax=freshwater metagenome TaxID=449393 RepID=A0A6J7PNG8_9ZZZZ